MDSGLFALSPVRESLSAGRVLSMIQRSRVQTLVGPNSGFMPHQNTGMKDFEEKSNI